MKKVVGVLAIQGDYQAHAAVLEKLKIECREVRNSNDLNIISHLIVPGGETTTIRQVTQHDGLWEKLSTFPRPVMGTCMGCILMADIVQDPDSRGWGMLDITIRRNAYGRQINSFTSDGKVEFIDEPFNMVFIRAPRIIRYTNSVKPIAWLDDEVTGVIAGNKMALTFHPELSRSTKLHEYFLEL